MHTDLFPETLLVTFVDGQPMTDSRKVAEHFHKRHDNVLRDIENLIAEVEKLGGGRLRFEASSYLNAQNKQQPMYRMDRLAFSILAGRFTGQKALAWQIDYHRAFEQMEAELYRRTDRFATALDAIRPGLRTAVEDAERQVPRAHTAEYLGKSVAAISYRRSVARRLGLLPAAKDSARAA